MKFEIRHGCFHYRNKPDILKDINVSLDGNQILAILGPNGVGKTTLLRCSLSFLDWTSGDCLIDGKSVGKMSPKQFWRNVGYVSQARETAFPYTLEDLVILGRSCHLRDWQSPSAGDWEKADKAMNMVGILPFRKALCTEVSGGQLQLALIARALCSEPSLLVLDEPEANLDLRNQLIVLEVLRKLCKEYGLSAILNTHYPEHAFMLSDKALLLYPDGTSSFGRTEDVLTERNLADSFGVQINLERYETEGFVRTLVIPSLAGQAKEHAAFREKTVQAVGL